MVHALKTPDLRAQAKPGASSESLRAIGLGRLAGEPRNGTPRQSIASGDQRASKFGGELRWSTLSIQRVQSRARCSGVRAALSGGALEAEQPLPTPSRPR
jgi:hypothetical protein